MLEFGDTIRCADIDDMVNTMYELRRCGVDVCSLFELDGQKGLWLKVTGLERTEQAQSYVSVGRYGCRITANGGGIIREWKEGGRDETEV